MPRRHQKLAFILLLATLPLLPQPRESTLAPTPPMGWNSWDSWGMTIDEAGVRASAEYMAQHLRSYGWQYVVVDGGWFIPKADLGAKPGSAHFTLTADGRYMPAPDRFPSAANGGGFKPLADYAHSLGLKFGIRLIRGIPREAVANDVPIADSAWHAADLPTHPIPAHGTRITSASGRASPAKRTTTPWRGASRAGASTSSRSTASRTIPTKLTKSA
jgi:hypothetical protein